MSTQVIDILSKRRSIYALGGTINRSNDELEQLIQSAIREAPSSFNSQSSRAVILFNGEHQSLWGIVEEALKAIVPSENFSETKNKLNSFAKAYGTILFFEDEDVITGLQEQFAPYADNFPKWSHQSTGIAQFAVWLALSEWGIGASLQHYNPLIDEAVHARWNIPKNWKLTAQMPFGSIENKAGDKTYIDNKDRFKIFGK